MAIGSVKFELNGQAHWGTELTDADVHRHGVEYP